MITIERTKDEHIRFVSARCVRATNWNWNTPEERIIKRR